MNLILTLFLLVTCVHNAHASGAYRKAFMHAMLEVMSPDGDITVEILRETTPQELLDRVPKPSFNNNRAYARYKAKLSNVKTDYAYGFLQDEYTHNLSTEQQGQVHSRIPEPHTASEATLDVRAMRRTANTLSTARSRARKKARRAVLAAYLFKNPQAAIDRLYACAPTQKSAQNDTADLHRNTRKAANKRAAAVVRQRHNYVNNALEMAARRRQIDPETQQTLDQEIERLSHKWYLDYLSAHEK